MDINYYNFGSYVNHVICYDLVPMDKYWVHKYNVEKYMIGIGTKRKLKFKLEFVRSISYSIPEELKEYMHGRGNRERRDSVSITILEERKFHQERLKSISHISGSLVKFLTEMGLGSKKRIKTAYSPDNNSTDRTNPLTLTGAGGRAHHLTSCSRDWPIFKHILPEIAFAGHSNSGKSTLVNAMVGVLPKKGPAGVSDRAGWTDQLCFYQLGKRPPILNIVDFPGYGLAVGADTQAKKEWTAMIKSFLHQRDVLSLCCILVDCTRGLCNQDFALIRVLNRANRRWAVVLTKCDLLTPIELAKSITLVEKDLLPYSMESPQQKPMPISKEKRVDKAESEKEATEPEEDLNEPEEELFETMATDHSIEDNQIEVDSKNMQDEIENDQQDDEIFDEKEDSSEPSGSENRSDLGQWPGRGIVCAVSANTGAGIQKLWKALHLVAAGDTTVQSRKMKYRLINFNKLPHFPNLIRDNSPVVREHINSSILRRKEAIRARINRK